ncbi:major head protein [Erwinia phage vB_EamM-Bue1]|uniref:Major head protein n=2 Tax=Nezavisimistyvirus TaxID=2841279 RepID=A0A0A0YSW8_9CAUD|nr:major head protein [Erwinia phage phiEa2809]YP_009837729.1 major head protein [Erwinia phage vB_EamM-Bue1]AIX13115.1 major head protein [Erwinia phage phiEa2809]AVO22967.1 major head protein [Erwinia phage vB_EamM-Bue1]
MSQKLVTEAMREMWKPVLEQESTQIQPLSAENVSIRLLQNQAEWNAKNLGESEAPASVNANVGKWQPVLIDMAKRLAPNNIAMDFFGVQPLAGPDGQIFALRARQGVADASNTQQSRRELFVDEAQTNYSGDQTTVHSGDPSGFDQVDIEGSGTGVSSVGKAMDTVKAEQLGSPAQPWARVGITIQKASVTAKSRGLYADYSHELRQDMMAIHGEDVDAILSDVMVTEIQSEMNREFIRTMNFSAKRVSKHGANGVIDMNTNTSGRWALEKWKYMLFVLEVEANQIAVETRRGKGNRVLCSPNVASALAMAGMLDYSPALNSQASLAVDPTGQTFAGVLSNGMRVYIDPYAIADYITVAFKGATALDAGIFYAPYVPLEMYKTQGESTFAPRMAFKTRYGLAANPFVQIPAGQDPQVYVTSDGIAKDSNPYFRKALIKNLF